MSVDGIGYSSSKEHDSADLDAGASETYSTFLRTKLHQSPSVGFDASPDSLNPMLYDFQKDLTSWALRRGRAAIFCDCGMGKTPMQLEWARRIPGRVLILAPLAVAKQTEREGKKFGVPATYARDGRSTSARIVVTNYEMLDHFDADSFDGIVLDESSILKSYDSKTRTKLIETFAGTPYRLACTATPAPNDYMELGNHAEFLGIMSRVEMLSMFFVHDGGETQKWRLKGHAEEEFWRWLCTWAVMLRKPSDLDYDDGAFILPPLRYKTHTIHVEKAAPGFLFPVEAQTLQERISARAATVSERALMTSRIVNADSHQWLVWCGLNKEGDELTKLIPGAVQVKGSDALEHKESTLVDFASGKIRVLVTKPSIAGFGMNFQNCSRMAFVGLSDSWESWYQAVRRCWRFGQTKPVEVHVITSPLEGAVVKNVQRKERDATRMAESMVRHMRSLSEEEVRGIRSATDKNYELDLASGEGWIVYLGDCVEILRMQDAESIDYSIFSPPFASLYTYSNSERDMGNVRDREQFFDHFHFLVKELGRVMKPGRLVSVHCMDLPTSKVRDGHIGLYDFRGDIIRAFEREGFFFHSNVTIWKDPVTAMQRTKALGLLHKQLKKDSCMSRQGVPDYLCTFRREGDNPSPVAHTNATFPVSRWQLWASPVWTDINPSDTLQFRSAREHKDERHIAPLQLEVVRRGIELWSNPGDLVLSPFAGIGTEGYVALQCGRRFLGAELKRSYWIQAKKNLTAARQEMGELFRRKDVAEAAR